MQTRMRKITTPRAAFSTSFALLSIARVSLLTSPLPVMEMSGAGRVMVLTVPAPRSYQPNCSLLKRKLVWRVGM